MTESAVIKRWVHSHIRSLDAYSVAKADHLVKLGCHGKSLRLG